MSRRILIVGDNPNNLRRLRSQLEAEGMAVVEAGNGKEALERLAETSVDGVISDIPMPHMDGYRLCLELRKQPRLAALPFILYSTTYNASAENMLARAAGADAHLAKPAPVALLLGALADAQAKGGLHRPPTQEPEDPACRQYSQSLLLRLEERNMQLDMAYEGLAQTEAQISGLVESALDSIIIIDASQRIVLFNAASEQMFGCSRDWAMGKSVDTFIPARFRHVHHRNVRAFAEGDVAARKMGARIVWAQHQKGHEFPVEASISRLATPSGWLFTVFLRDVTERYEAEQLVAQGELRLRRANRVLSVLSRINALFVRATDRDELLRESCRIAVEAGQFPKTWIGLVEQPDCRMVVAASAGGDAGFRAQVQAYLESPEFHRSHWVRELCEGRTVILNEISPDHPLLLATESATTRSVALLPLVREDRTVGVLALHAAEPGFFDEAEMKLLVELAGDIANALDHLEKTERLRFLASYDDLTGLPNRAFFTEHLARAMKLCTAGECELSLMLVDIERFRRVNETLGREAGDQLLRQVGARLRAQNPSAARLGVDVFALVFEGVGSADDVVHEFSRLRKSCCGEPCHVAGQALRIGCRAGVSVFPTDGADAETLLRNAEAALRRARASAEPLAFYAPGLNARAAEALSLESKLRRAIDHDEFVLHYQPKIGMGTRRITGLEALIRWQDPEKGLIAPGYFIPVLEECGLIGEVGEWALRQALRDQSAWRAEGSTPPRVAVNVSPIQLRHPGFAAGIAALLADHGDPAANELELEITESVIMDDVQRNIATLDTVRTAGVTVAVDDFGTGYCSLSYIAKLPVTSLKIDRAFILGMTAGPEGLAIVSSIIALAHALRLKVVAEGVETEDQAVLLHLLACDEAQGYLFSRPLPAAAISSLLRRNAPLPTTAGT